MHVETMDGEFALKECLLSSEDDGKYVEREITTLKALNHPNIVKLHSCFAFNKIVYIQLELAQGKSLKGWLHESGALPLFDSLFVVEQLAEALRHVHSRGIAHRDLKPANVMLSRGSCGIAKVKLIDFGLARFTPHNGRMTSICGSLKFLAPEMILCERREAEGYGVGVDMWGLGLIMFYMLFGIHPFGGSTAFDTVEAIIQCSPSIHLPTRRPSGPIRALLLGLLTSTPQARLSALDVLQQPLIAEAKSLAAKQYPHLLSRPSKMRLWRRLRYRERWSV